jgi:NADPH:quinone reductase
VAETVRNLTDGRGVDVVYDSVGRTTAAASLASLARRGMLVLVGESSGQIEPITPKQLKSAGSLFLTRPTLADHIRTREELTWRASELFAWIAAGDLDVRITEEHALEDAGEAHRRLEARLTSGKVLLVP